MKIFVRKVKPKIIDCKHYIGAKLEREEKRSPLPLFSKIKEIALIFLKKEYADFIYLLMR